MFKGANIDLYLRLFLCGFLKYHSQVLVAYLLKRRGRMFLFIILRYAENKMARHFWRAI
jgi:hypothetical protein